MKKGWIIGLGVVVIAGAAIYVTQNTARQAAAQGTTQTAEVTRGDLETTVGATGTVRAAQTANLAWETSGTVAEVTVNPGDVVQQGDVLAKLNTASLSPSMISATADLVAAQQDLENLQVSEVEKAQAELDLANAQADVDDAQHTRNQLNYGRVSQDSIDVTRADLLLAENKVDQMQEIFDQFSGRPEDDPMRASALSNLVAAKEDRDALQRKLNWMTGDASEQEIAEADATLALAQAKLADAQREWDRLKDGPDPDDIAAAEAKIASIQATLAQTEIVAPFAASITEVNVQPGDVISTGSSAFRLDNLAQLYVDMDVSEVDISSVKVGQEATLVFDAIQGKEYHGQVNEVALVGESDQGVVNFKVTVALTDADEAVKSGMTAAVNITISQLTDVLLVPNRAVTSTDGVRTVTVLRAGLPVVVEIELGQISDQYSQVVSGDLQEGDSVLIGTTTTETSTNQGGFMMMGGR